MNFKFRLILCAVLVFSTAALGVFNIIDIFSSASAVEEPAIQCLAQAEKQFVVRELDGYVAVFFEGEDEVPVMVTDISVELLRDYDRELIKNGIVVPSKERLLMMLEDLGS